MIEPTVGRVVWYHPAPDEHGPDSQGQPLSAQIAHVTNDRLVNLGVLNAAGVGYGRTDVVLVQEGDPVPPRPYCEWMPFQKGQAAKTEAAEAKAAGTEIPAAQPQSTPAGAPAAQPAVPAAAPTGGAA